MSFLEAGGVGETFLKRDSVAIFKLDRHLAATDFIEPLQKLPCVFDVREAEVDILIADAVEKPQRDVRADAAHIDDLYLVSDVSHKFAFIQALSDFFRCPHFLPFPKSVMMYVTHTYYPRQRSES